MTSVAVKALEDRICDMADMFIDADDKSGFRLNVQSALSAQVQDVAIPAGWKKTPERYSNYPWAVDLYADGWHLSNHDFSASSRDVSVHSTAAEAMAAAPAAKQGEVE